MRVGVSQDPGDQSLPEEALQLWQRVRSSRGALWAVPTADRWQAWQRVVGGMMEDRALHERLAHSAGWSEAGARAAVQALLAGLSDSAAGAEFERAARLREAGTSQGEPGTAFVVLAGNLPLLAAQPCFFALAAGRPTLFKQASGPSSLSLDFGLPDPRPTRHETGLAVLLERLAFELPVAGASLAATRWRGGAPEYVELERQLAQQAAPLVVYGDESVIETYRRWRGEGTTGDERVAYFGPRISLGVIGAPHDEGLDPEIVDLYERLATDVVLFEQQGCLSPQSVLVIGDPENSAEIAGRLADGLKGVARRIPPTPSSAHDQSLLQQHVLNAQMEGTPVLAGPWGTVLVSRLEQALDPLPGRRTIRCVVAEREEIEAFLVRHADSLQGIALGGVELEVADTLRSRGIRLKDAGALQQTEAAWQNCGIDLATVFS